MKGCLASGEMAPLSPLEDVGLAPHTEGFKVVGNIPVFLFIQAFQTCLYLNEKEQIDSFINVLLKKEFCKSTEDYCRINKML